MQNNTPKLEEAQKLLREKACNWAYSKYVFNHAKSAADAWEELEEAVSKLLEIQDLISYERGREDQRNKDIEMIKKCINKSNRFTSSGNEMVNYCNGVLEAIIKVILNTPPTP